MEHRPPRNKGRHNIDKGMYDGYLYYRAFCREHNLGDKYKVDRTTYGKIIKNIHKEIANSLLDDSKDIKLPCGLPRIRIMKYKRKIHFNEDGTIDPRSMAVNWEATMALRAKDPVAEKMRKKVFFINDHTDGYSYMFKLERHGCNVKNLKMYKFRQTKELNRRLGRKLLDPYNKTDYYT